MRANARATRPEARLRSVLHRAGLRFRKNVRPIASIRCRPDVVFPRDRVAVFVDGCFWHGCPQHFRPPQSNAAYWDAKIARNMQRDKRNDEELSRAGWRVIRVWEHEDIDGAAHLVRAELMDRRACTQPGGRA
jgi:DNA mismatch endonuclease (patch repair protein)